MSIVEVRHRASEALQKPSMHETARHESKLWIFDPVSSRAAERKQEANAASLSGDDGKLGVLQPAWFLIGDFVASKPQHGPAWAEHGRRHDGG